MHCILNEFPLIILNFVFAPRSLLLIQLSLEQIATFEIDFGNSATFFSATTRFLIIFT